MKKQITLLAAMIAASGFTAFGQGYMTFSGGTHTVYDEFTTAGVGVGAADMDVIALWAPTTATDSLGTGVATTGVTSEQSSVLTTIANMISTGGWATIVNSEAGTTGVGNLVSVPTTTKGQFTYNGGYDTTAAIEASGVSLGETIQLVVIGFNSSATLSGQSDPFTGASNLNDIGWASSFDYLTGASSTDPDGGNSLSADGLAAFGVSPLQVTPTPEPTTLALAGLGGLSMLFLRRRKA